MSQKTHSEGVNRRNNESLALAGFVEDVFADGDLRRRPRWSLYAVGNGSVRFLDQLTLAFTGKRTARKPQRGSEHIP